MGEVTDDQGKAASSQLPIIVSISLTLSAMGGGGGGVIINRTIFFLKINVFLSNQA